MAHEVFAPWGEAVPDAGRMTVDELLALPQDEWMYELVEGRLVRMPGSGGEASLIALRLAAALLAFADAHGLGVVTGADGTYNLTQPGDPAETGLVPDVAFVRREHVPRRTSPVYAQAWHVAPDLVVEVASPNQYRPDMKDKAQRYLTAGVRMVWVIWPKSRQVDVWRAGAQGAPQVFATLKSGDALDGLDVLPGFSHPVADLFA